MFYDGPPGMTLELLGPSPSGVDLEWLHPYTAARPYLNTSRRVPSHAYAYAANNPVNMIDPSGLAEHDCRYYSEKCRCTSWWNLCQVLYYCLAANLVCKNAGDGPWRNCTRRCLQAYDNGRGNLIEDGNVPILGTVIGCLEHAPLEVIDHVVCFAVCRWDADSY